MEASRKWLKLALRKGAGTGWGRGGDGACFMAAHGRWKTAKGKKEKRKFGRNIWPYGWFVLHVCFSICCTYMCLFTPRALCLPAIVSSPSKLSC